MAKGKVEDVAKKVEGDFLIIGSDTTVHLGNKYLNKPATEEEAIDHDKLNYSNEIKAYSVSNHTIFCI